MRRILPNLIIAGVNKAATTSLFSYLSSHPDVCASSIKETNYFLGLAYKEHLSPIHEYAKCFEHCEAKKYILEASPRYIYGGKKVGVAISEVLGEIKIVIMLRDPVYRIFSYYKHVLRNMELSENMSFTDYVNRALHDIKQVENKNESDFIDIYQENIFVRGIVQGVYITYLKLWEEIFGVSLKIYFFEDLKWNPHQFMQDICEWLGIDSGVYRNDEFSIENQGIVLRNMNFHNIAESINSSYEAFFRKHMVLKRILRQIYYFFNKTKHKQEGIEEQTLKLLYDFYDPFNKELYNMLVCNKYANLPEWLVNCGV